MHVLQTDHLVLEPLTAAHAEAVYSFLSHPSLYTYIPRDPPDSLQTLKDRYNRLENRISPDQSEIWLNWLIFDTTSKRYVGKTEATILTDGTTYIAYEIDPNEWHKGYATRACRVMIEDLQSVYNAHPIKAHVDTRNESSIRLLERLGFIRRDTRKNADFFKGHQSDEYIYELPVIKHITTD